MLSLQREIALLNDTYVVWLVFASRTAHTRTSIGRATVASVVSSRARPTACARKVLVTRARHVCVHRAELTRARPRATTASREVVACRAGSATGASGATVATLRLILHRGTGCARPGRATAATSLTIARVARRAATAARVACGEAMARAGHKSTTSAVGASSCTRRAGARQIGPGTTCVPW